MSTEPAAASQPDRPLPGDPDRRATPATAVGQVVRGLLMGSADVVPGVSGGTVALVLGIYTRLLDNIHTGATALKELIRLRPRDAWAALRRVEWVWLVSLVVGIGLAVALLATVIERLLVSAPEAMAGLFTGLVTASAVVAWRMLRRPGVVTGLITIVVAAVFFVLLGLRADVHAVGGATDLPWWGYLGSGALAICAMILPGISGSFILVLLGTYGAVLGAVTERDLAAVGLVAVGAVAGLALFSSLLSWALHHHHDRVLAAMVGLLLGSLRVLWPWPGGLESTVLGPPTGPVVLPVVLAVVGFALVVIIDRVAARLGSGADG